MAIMAKATVWRRNIEISSLAAQRGKRHARSAAARQRQRASPRNAYGSTTASRRVNIKQHHWTPAGNGGVSVREAAARYCRGVWLPCIVLWPSVNSYVCISISLACEEAYRRKRKRNEEKKRKHGYLSSIERREEEKAVFISADGEA